MLNSTRAAAMVLAGVALAALAGCGGRVSRPVAAHEPYDGQLDCAHLAAEKSVNAARASDLPGEQKNDTNNNLGLLVVSPLLLDLSDSEQIEIKAFAARQQVLDQLMTRACASTHMANMSP